MKFVGPEPAIPNPPGLIRALLIEETKISHRRRWEELGSCRQTKEFLLDCNMQTTEFLLGMSRSNLRKVVGMLNLQLPSEQDED